MVVKRASGPAAGNGAMPGDERGAEPATSPTPADDPSPIARARDSGSPAAPAGGPATGRATGTPAKRVADPGAEPATGATAEPATGATAEPAADPAAEPATDATVEPAAAAVPHAAPRTPVAEQTPVQASQLLDPRAIARASLEAGRNASLWWTSAGVVVATIVALVVGTRAGAYTLAGVLAACAVVRAVLPHPGPVAVSARAKPIDVTVLAVLAVSIGALAHLLPGRLF